MSDIHSAIAEYLQDKDLIAGEGIDTFFDVFPDEPNNIVVIYEYGGAATMQPFDDTEHVSLQISARCTSAAAAKAKATDICNALASFGESRLVKFTDSRYGQVYIRQRPFKLRTDDKNRSIYGFNIGVTTAIK